LSNFNVVKEKNLNDIDSDLNRLLVPGKFLEPNHKKITNYLSNHFDIVSDHVLFNLRILKQIGMGGHSVVINQFYLKLMF
jgi:hypothetical protein